MGWDITCTDESCTGRNHASDIVELISKCRDASGWFQCSCGKPGYVHKRFTKQEGGTWEPYLKGIITLNEPDKVYKPFVFLVSSGPSANVSSFWFSYYKDLRKVNGRLKMGYGPGGPPNLNKQQVLDLISELVKRKILSSREVADAGAVGPAHS